MADTTLLKVSGLKVAYGGIQAVKGVLRGGAELVSLIGANGAGKTTTLKAITGAAGGRRRHRVHGAAASPGQGAWDLVKQGLVMVPEGRGTFTRMTIVENLQMGAFIRNDTGRMGSRPTSTRCSRSSRGLKERRNAAGRHDVRRRAADAGDGRALMAGQVLLLDEPSMGLSPIMVDKIFSRGNARGAREKPVRLFENYATYAPWPASRIKVLTSITPGARRPANRTQCDEAWCLHACLRRRSPMPPPEPRS